LEGTAVEYPRIRPDVNAFPLSVEGQAMICFQDSQRLSEGTLIPQAVFARIVAFFDGRHSIRDIQYEAMKRYGELLYTEQIEAVAEQLDRALLLESPRFRQALDGLMEDFHKGPVRPSFFSGKSYASDPSGLKVEMEGYFTKQGGPGGFSRSRRASGLRGILAPHIDFQRGGHCYAWAYRAVAEAEEADLYIILGIAHAPSKGRFSVTLKDFETPLGVARTDRDFVNALSRRCSQDIFLDEFLHRSEHSVEFQVVFLQYVLGPEMKAAIVPILCGSFDDYLQQGKVPEEDPQVAEFLGALRSVAIESQKRICFISGVDLSHMGPQFGDAGAMDGLSRSRIQQEDLETLEKVACVDADGFLRLLQRDMNRRRICGFPAIYVQLRTMEALRGEVLKYDQGATPDGRSMVSFAALAFYG